MQESAAHKLNAQCSVAFKKSLLEIGSAQFYFTTWSKPEHVIEDALRSYVIEQDEWDEHIPAIEFTMNNHQNEDDDNDEDPRKDRLKREEQIDDGRI